MALFKISGNAFERVTETTFASERLQERQDIQRLLKADISVIDSDLLVVAEEFGEWEDSSRRIDLLCVDSKANLVVVEIKRTEDGGHMELQAVRYAAMVSAMTFVQLAAAHARYLGVNLPTAEAALRSFFAWEDGTEGSLTDEVRIILLAANFSREITTAVLWLNRQGLDVTCYRLKPHKLGPDLLVDIQQLIPLPEAAEYETRLKAQRQESERVASSRKELFFRFWSQLIPKSASRTSILSSRSPTRDHWLSGRIGRSGFNLSFVLNQHASQVECYIRFSAGPDIATEAFRALEAQKEKIETSFGAPLVWEDLPTRLGCRISFPIDGGWRNPETEWPDLQDRLIDAMARLEGALKGPIQALTF